MKIFFIVGVVVIFVIAAVIFVISNDTKNPLSSPPQLKQSNSTPQTGADVPVTSLVAENLDTPWAIAFLPDTSMIVTERNGQVNRIINNTITPIIKITAVNESGEGGLLGMALHPNFETNKYVYFYYTYSNNGNNTLNRVVRMTYNNDQLTDEEIILNAIPGALNHNGGRIKFGPDNFLYIGTGDAQEPSLAQNKSSLAGKILRITDTGKAAPGNPFNSPIYSYGHRNVQGLAWDAQGNLWATEHGRSGFPSGLDELNSIQSGNNYGWPTIQGDEQRAGMETPRKNSGGTTWAPSGIAFIKNSLFFSGLRGQSLYQATIQNNQIPTVVEHFNGEYGRIREVILGPDNLLYISTSNNDGRGLAKSGDDKIIRINPEKL